MKKITTLVIIIMAISECVGKANDAFGGIGALIGKREGQIEIILVGKGTPADEGGLHIRDKIIKKLVKNQPRI